MASEGHDMSVNTAVANMYHVHHGSNRDRVGFLFQGYATL